LTSGGRLRTGLVVVAILTGWARTSVAQPQTPDGGPAPSQVRVRLGPLLLNPTLALTNLGVDDNVFNEPPGAPPRSDFTMTLSPQTDWWMRLGRTWLSGNLRQDIVWYKDYESERSGNTSYGVAWRVPLNRLAFSTSASWLTTNERQGAEIDGRVDRSDTRYESAVEIRALARTYLGVNAGWRRSEFESGAAFLGANLHDELTRRAFVGGLTVRQQLTPLTSLGFTASRAEDRFEYSRLRDSNSMVYAVGLTFDPAALIRGTATVGYRRFDARSPDVPDYSGVTTGVDLTYTLFGATRFAVQLARDVQYSYEATQPYYLSTSVNASAAQQIYGPWEAVGRTGWQTLGYRDRGGVAVAVPDRSDDLRTYGGGVAFRLGPLGAPTSMRIGFNVDRQVRESPDPTRRYEGLRYGTSITFGT
jgi:hypothetical protein